MDMLCIEFSNSPRMLDSIEIDVSAVVIGMLSRGVGMLLFVVGADIGGLVEIVGGMRF